jgi:hypothetical protein
VSQPEKLRGEAAGVPFVAVPPDEAVNDAPSVVVWHLLDPPRSETAMQAALPMAGLAAWRVYLGLPMSGTRLPQGGLEAFFQLGYEDAVLRQFEPIVRGAVTEFPAALADLRERFGIGRGPLGLIGGSAGALVALSVLTETDVPVSGVALVSPATRLASIVVANERRFEVTYPWTDRSRAIAGRLDFVARADEVAARDVPLLLVVGAVMTWMASASPPRSCGQRSGGTPTIRRGWSRFLIWSMHSRRSRDWNPPLRHLTRHASTTWSSSGFAGI